MELVRQRLVVFSSSCAPGAVVDFGTLLEWSEMLLEGVKAKVLNYRAEEYQAWSRETGAYLLRCTL